MSTFFAKSFHQASYFRWAWNCSFLNGRNSFLYLSKFIWALEKLLRTLSSDKKHFMQKKWNENKIIKSTKMVELKKKCIFENHKWVFSFLWGGGAGTISTKKGGQILVNLIANFSADFCKIATGHFGFYSKPNLWRKYLITRSHTAFGWHLICF